MLAGTGETASAAGKDVSISSGPAKATVGTGQWSFSFADGRRKTVLREQAGSGAGPVGRLGFEADGKWAHATRVLKKWQKGKARYFLLKTTDSSRRLKVAVAPAPGGTIRLTASIVGSVADVDSIGMAFKAPKGQKYLGFGERSNAVNQRGNEVENWVGEGPYQSVEYQVVKLFVPEWGLRDRPDATYFPIPWLMSSAGYGVLVENPNPSYFHLGSDRKDTWSVELSRTVDGLAQQPEDSPPPRSITLRFFPGPEPADVVRRMSGVLGRQPAPSPVFFGPWLQTNESDADTVDILREQDVPTSVYQTYLHYLPCAGQTGQEQGQIDRTALIHQAGMAITTYFNPMICRSLPDFTDLVADGAITMNREGAAYPYRYLGYQVGQFDFTSEIGRSAYGDRLNEAVSHGYDGWMEDFGEYAPPDAVYADGSHGMVEHNPYVRQYHCAAWEKTKSHPRPLLRFVRSGFTGSAACSPVVWGGDPSTTWDFDGLLSSVRNGISMGLSGVGIWGSDIGGFFAITADQLSPELSARWVQFGAFSGVMRNEADGYSYADTYRPQVIDSEQIGNWRRYSKIRTQLYPYISSAAWEYRRSGMPMMRAMLLDFPKDPKSAGLDNQYMFGPDLLVAPVVEPGQSSRRLYLPEGRWIDFWRTFSYDESSGAIDSGPAKLLNGGGWRTVPAPAEEIPLAIRAGAMITALPPDVETLSDFGQEDQSIVHLDDRRQRTLFAFPRGSSSDRFEKNGLISSVEGKGVWKLKITDTEARPWRIRAATGAMKQPFTVKCVSLNGKKLAPGAWQTGPGQVEVNLPATARRLNLAFSRNRCGG